MPTKTGHARPTTRLGLASHVTSPAIETRGSAKLKPAKVAPKARAKRRGKARR